MRTVLMTISQAERAALPPVARVLSRGAERASDRLLSNVPRGAVGGGENSAAHVVERTVKASGKPKFSSYLA